MHLEGMPYGQVVIRVRRVRSRVPFVHSYELDLAGRSIRARRGTAVRHLEKRVGLGDAWSFINAADRAFSEGSSSWAVEYDESGG
jgi:hypothetical protein